MIPRLSLGFSSIAILTLIIFVTELPNIQSKAHISDEAVNNEIIRVINDRFTITKEDKDYFEDINRKIVMDNADSDDVDMRIVAGQEATLGELPYQCALQFKSTGFSYCGAALIDPLGTNVPKWIITADHCVKDRSPSSLQVVCGVLKMSQTKPWNRFDIEVITQHPYSSDTKIGDLALIQLKVTPSELTHRADSGSNGMIPINIPDMATFNKFAGEKCTVSGWGRPSSGAASKPDTLNRADVTVPTQGECSEMYANVTDKFRVDSMMCAGGKDRDACQGDSGGPLKCEVEGKAYLAGLVSWGIGCATEGVPGGYTNVANYRSWIIEQITNAEKKK